MFESEGSNHIKIIDFGLSGESTYVLIIICLLCYQLVLTRICLLFSFFRPIQSEAPLERPVGNLSHHGTGSFFGWYVQDWVHHPSRYVEFGMYYL